VFSGGRDQTFLGDRRRQQWSYAWSSVRTRSCAGNADFDELIVKQERMFDLETIEVPNRSSQSGEQIQTRSITHSHITLAKVRNAGAIRSQ
jgi:hypothetical protein